MTFSRGASLLEALVALAVLLVLFGIALEGFGKGSRAGALSVGAATVRGALEEARARTLAARSDSSYGVRFDGDAVVLFRGSAYDPADAANERIPLPRALELLAELSSGGSEVTFLRLSGEAAATGTLTLRFADDPARSRTLTLHKTGLVGD